MFISFYRINKQLQATTTVGEGGRVTRKSLIVAEQNIQILAFDKKSHKSIQQQLYVSTLRSLQSLGIDIERFKQIKEDHKKKWCYQQIYQLASLCRNYLFTYTNEKSLISIGIS